jgi:AraC-like DNA-binding protein
MRHLLHNELPAIIAGLTPERLVVPPARPAHTPARPTGKRRPVPIPFYIEPSPHAHAHVEIAVILQGPVFFELEGHARTLETGDVVLFPPHALHYDSYSTERQGYAVMWFMLPAGKPRMNVSHYRPRHGFALVTLWDLRPELIPEDDWALIASFRKSRRPQLPRVRELLWALHAAVLEAARRSGPVRRTETERKVVRDAVAFLREHLCEAPTVEMAAEFVGLSPTYLTTLVRKELKHPLHDILVGLRLDKAKELLASSRLSVKEIAHLSGYSAADYFTRTFRRATGVSPRQFRDRPSRAPRPS